MEYDPDNYEDMLQWLDTCPTVHDVTPYHTALVFTSSALPGRPTQVVAPKGCYLCHDVNTDTWESHAPDMFNLLYTQGGLF